MAASHDESVRVEQAPGVGRAGTHFEAAGAGGLTVPKPTGEATRPPERLSFATSTGPAPLVGGTRGPSGQAFAAPAYHPSIDAGTNAGPSGNATRPPSAATQTSFSSPTPMLGPTRPPPQ
jgi:hypothetical protein